MPKTATNQIQFLQSLPWTAEIEWLGTTGYVKLDESRRAVIRLTLGGVMHHYEGFEVEIVDKQLGKIDHTRLMFSDIMSVDEAGRVEQDKNGRAKISVISYVGWQWYITQPADESQITDAVEAYINLFR